MPYIKGVWVDEILAGAARYDILENGGGAFKATMQINLATAITQAGTQLNATRMNNIEDGVEDVDERVTVLESAVAYPPGFLHGLTLSNNTGDATNDIDIAIGKCRNKNDTMNISLTSALTKRLDAAWAVGSGNGGLDHGSIANATYHKHLIKRSDTSVVDAIFSLSHDEQFTITVTIASPGVVTWTGRNSIGHGLVAGSTFKFSTTGALPTGITAGTTYYVIATGLTATTFQFAATDGGAAINTSGSQSGVHTGIALPLLPANYDGYRRIGSIVRTGAAIKSFIQDADVFVWKVPVKDIDVTNPGISAVTRTMTLPIGIRVEAILTAIAASTSGAADNPSGVFISDLSITDTAASISVASLYSWTSGAIQNYGGSLVRAFTNAAAQVRSRIEVSTANSRLVIQAHGWVDTRGRLL